MSEIEWTDETWQVVSGCTPVSTGCRNCYSARLAGTRLKNHPRCAGLTRQAADGRHVFTGEVRLHDDQLKRPLRWTRPRKIFVADRGDLFHEAVKDDFVDAVFGVMAAAPQHAFQILTKRPQRALAYLAKSGRIFDIIRFADWYSGMGDSFKYADYPLPNVIIGGSIEDQATAEQRRPPMADIAALGWKTFVSYEPALEPVDWAGWEFLDWLISGGESGPGARISPIACHRQARDFCREHGIPYLFKQWGEWFPNEKAGSDMYQRLGKAAAGRLLDGELHHAFPVL